ncbi:MAG: hypothetical protein GX055_09735, partial [Desulfovibrionales bacterium]|nr:hypothetical protein [Desulfovibrionales bacterium]
MAMSEHHDPCTSSVCVASSPVRWMRRAVAWIVVGLAVIFSAVELGLPWLTQQVLVPWVAQELDTDEASIQVRALRLGGLDIGPIRLGPGLSVQAIQVDWSLTGLVRGRIAHVRLMGLEVQAMHEETGWSIAGLPVPVQTQSKEADSGQPFFLPRIDTFTVDGRLMAEHQGNAMALAFFTQGQMTGKGVAARLVVDSSYGSATVRLDAGQTDPYSFFCDWSLDMHTLVIPARSGLHLAGSSSVIRTATGWNIQTKARLAQVDIMLPGKQNLILAPSQIEISALTDEQTRIQADLLLGDLAAQTLAGTVEIHGLAATIHATASPENGSGAFTLSGSQARAIAVEKKAHLEALKVQGDFSWGSEQSVTATLELGALKIQMPEAEVSAQAVTAAIHATQSKDNGTGTVHLSKAQVTVRVPGLDLATAALQAQGEMSWGTEMYANATLKTDAQVKSKDISATAQLTLPLAWPKPAPTPGQLDARVRWQNKDAAKLAVRLTQKQDFMSVDGQIHIQPVGIQATVQGQVHPFALRDSWAQFQAEHSLSLPGALADFVPQTRELSGSATVRAKGKVHLPQGVVQIPVQLEVRDAQIRHAQSGFTLDNGSASLDFDNILT